MVLGILVGWTAHAIIVRHDVPDASYVVEGSDHPALAVLFPPDDCMGTLVDPSHVLTVAHCAVDVEPGLALDLGGTERTVDVVTLHPDWRDRDVHDIAVLRLTAPVTDVDPVPLYRGDAEQGARITLFGRGVTATGLVGEEGGSSDGRLRRATNTVRSADEHVLELVFASPSDPGVTELEGVGASGDSGGPVFIEVGGGSALVGLNSYGEEVGDAGIGQYGSADYQTRVSAYAPWVDDVVAGRAPRGRRGCATGGSGGGVLAVVVAVIGIRRRRSADQPSTRSSRPRSAWIAVRGM